MSERAKTAPNGANAKPSVTAPTEHPSGIVGLLRDAVEDIRAVRRADPAARDTVEVVLTYPGLHALWAHRVSHGLWRRKHNVAARVLSHVTRHFTGIEIHPAAEIGRRVFIDHGMGVVIGETTVIGDDCLIYKGVVLGGTTLSQTKRHPTIGRGVVIGSNACILGAVDIGDGVRVGSGSVVIKNVPEGSTVVGIPGRIVSVPHTNRADEPDLDHARLPDPTARLFKDMLIHIDRLTHRLETLEAHFQLSPEELAEKLERHEQQDELEREFLEAYQQSEFTTEG